MKSVGRILIAVSLICLFVTYTQYQYHDAKAKTEVASALPTAGPSTAADSRPQGMHRRAADADFTILVIELAAGLTGFLILKFG